MIKKLFLILILSIFAILLAGCSNSGNDQFKAYRGMSAVTIFNKGEQQLAKQNWPNATQDFQALDAMYPFGPYARQGQLDIIYAYYKNDDYASGLAAAERYIRLYPRGPYVDYAYYMKGLMEFNSGFTWLQRKMGTDPAPRDMSDKKQAFIAFSEVVNLFSDSPYAQDSAYRMAYIRNLIARQNVLVAQFYMKRKAYLAAANRAAYVVQHFNGSPQVIPAFVIMVKAYRKLHLEDLANNTMKIFATSYPNSPELHQLM